MIFTDRKITIRNGKSTINEPVILYRGDYEVSIKFTIMESKFRFKSGVNLVDSEKASHGQLAILTPYGGNVFSEIVKCEDGTVTFTLTKEMIDQLEEVGLYSFQIRLFDYYRESRVSIPPVEFGIEVREPVASEDHDNEVNNAIVGYSIAKVIDPKEENVGPTFDDNGNYNETIWETGDRISEGKLNKIEDAIDTINKNEKTLDKKINSNYNVLNHTKADKNEIFSMNNMGPDIRTAMTGGSVAVVGNESVFFRTLHSSVRDVISDYTPIDVEYILGYYDRNLIYNSFNTWKCAVVEVDDSWDIMVSGGNTNPNLNLVSFVDNTNKIIGSIQGGTVYTEHKVIVPSNTTRMYISYEISTPLEIRKREYTPIQNKLNKLNKDVMLIDNTVKSILYNQYINILHDLSWMIGGIDGSNGSHNNAKYCIKTTTLFVPDQEWVLQLSCPDGCEICILKYYNEEYTGIYKVFTMDGSYTIEKGYGYMITLLNKDKTEITYIPDMLDKFSIGLGTSIVKTNGDLVDLDTRVTNISNDIKKINDNIEGVGRLLIEDMESQTMSYSIVNGIVYSGYALDGVTNTHPFVYFKKGVDTLIFDHIISDDWIAIGGDLLTTTALAIGEPWNIRLIDLGPTNGLSVDINITDKANIGDSIKLTWHDTTLMAYKDTHDGLGFKDWFEVDLDRYDRLNAYKIEKRFGCINSYAKAPDKPLMLNVRYREILTIIDRLELLEGVNDTTLPPLVNKTWNAVGDSITSRNDYQRIVCDKTGLISRNYGISSSTMAVNNTYLKNQSVVERVCGLNGNTAYPDADIWTIFAGVNDWLYKTPIGSFEERDNSTFYGALRSICENIILRPNDPKLILFTPLQSNRNGANSEGVVMNEYRNAIIAVGEYYSVPVLDLYKVGGLNPVNLNKTAPDGVHPTTQATLLYTPKIIDELNRLY